MLIFFWSLISFWIAAIIIASLPNQQSAPLNTFHPLKRIDLWAIFFSTFVNWEIKHFTVATNALGDQNRQKIYFGPGHIGPSQLYWLQIFEVHVFEGLSVQTMIFNIPSHSIKNNRLNHGHNSMPGISFWSDYPSMWNQLSLLRDLGLYRHKK